MAKKVESITLRPSSARQAMILGVCSKRPMFIWGPPGIGKSQIMAQIASELGFEFVDVRLSQMDPTDLRGIPFPAHDEHGREVMRWSPPSFYRDPQRPGARKVLYFFDEMNSAPQSIQAAAYQIILDRKIGEYHLGKDDVVFAAGNRETDRGATFKMPTPLMNRFVHIEMRHDFDDWQEWAINNLIHRSVVGYLTWQKHELFDFQPSSASRGFATPRSWEFVSQMVADDPNVGDEVLLAVIAGAVGDGIAVKFMEYRKLNEKLPNPSDILTGKVKSLKDDQKETSIMYALTVGLCYELKEKHDAAIQAKNTDGGKSYDDWIKMADNFFGFIMGNFQPEMTILGARTILSSFKLKIVPNKMSNWKPFAARHSNLILDN